MLVPRDNLIVQTFLDTADSARDRRLSLPKRIELESRSTLLFSSSFWFSGTHNRIRLAQKCLSFNVPIGTYSASLQRQHAP